MEYTNIPVISTLLIAIFISSNWNVATSSLLSETEHELEFSYQCGAATGPDRWGEIHDRWTLCKHGEMQSPIDLYDKRVRQIRRSVPLRGTYRPASAVMKNRGHDIMIKWIGEAGGIWLNGTEFNLKQVHWHLPSEHTINGRRFSLEMHMVHESADDKIASIAILYKIGREDPFISKMKGYIRGMKDLKGAEEKVGILHPNEIKTLSNKYFRYVGSLTTPPCTEGIIWNVIRKVRTVSKEQVRLLKDAVHDGWEANARPRQLIEDRVISFHRSQ